MLRIHAVAVYPTECTDAGSVSLASPAAAHSSCWQVDGKPANRRLRVTARRNAKDNDGRPYDNYDESGSRRRLLRFAKPLKVLVIEIRMMGGILVALSSAPNDMPLNTFLTASGAGEGAGDC